MQQSGLEDHLCPAPVGASDAHKGDGNHDLRGANDLKEVVSKLIPNSTGKDIEKTCQSIHLLHDVFFRKVKVLKNPKCELGKLIELHGEGSSSGKVTGYETGAKGEQVQECLKCSLLMTRNKRSYL